VQARFLFLCRFCNSLFSLRSVVTKDRRLSSACKLQVPIGQKINLTLINYARVGLPTDWTGPGGAVGQAAVRPKVCYQLADIRERTVSGGETVRTITVCEGAERTSHVYTSSSNSLYVDIVVTKILNVHFLLHFQGQRVPGLGYEGLNPLHSIVIHIFCCCIATPSPSGGTSSSSSWTFLTWPTQCQLLQGPQVFRHQWRMVIVTHESHDSVLNRNGKTERSRESHRKKSSDGAEKLRIV